MYTANVYSNLQGVYGEIRVQGFQIYGDCMLPVIPVISHFKYTSKYCMEKSMYTLHVISSNFQGIPANFAQIRLLHGFPTSIAGNPHSIPIK